MGIPSEGIGSIPRPDYLVQAMGDLAEGRIDPAEFAALADRAVAETLKEMEATGAPILTDGEQSKPSFATYPLAGLDNLAPDGVVIPFEDGHTRQLPKLASGPFCYAAYAGQYVTAAKRHTALPVKQAVISPSAMALLYPEDGVEGYPRETFTADLIDECTKDIRSAFAAGADSVQIDFTEGRLCCKLDPSRGLLKDFIALNNAVIDRFSEAERQRIGIHTCPGGDQDSTHSADVDYGELLPDMFQINAGRFFMQLASEADRPRVLDIVTRERRLGQRVYVGVINVINEEVESAETVAERVLEAAEILGAESMGTTDDCGFSPFGDDTATARATAFAKIKARIDGTKIAAKKLSGA